MLIRYPQAPLREPACALLLQALDMSGDYARAVTVGTKYVKDYPDTANLWRGKILYYLGEGYYYSRDFNGAEDCYRRAYEAVASSDVAPYAHLGRSFCLLQLDREDEAIAGFRDLANARPNDTNFTATVVIGLGYAFFNKGSFDTARAEFEYLTKTCPDLPALTPIGYFYAAMCYRKLGFAGDAADAWEVIVNKYPQHPKAAEAAFRGGDIYFKSMDFEKAISMFRFVTEHYPVLELRPPGPGVHRPELLQPAEVHGRDSRAPEVP